MKYGHLIFIVLVLALSCSCQLSNEHISNTSFDKWGKMQICNLGILYIQHGGLFTLNKWNGEKLSGVLGINVIDFYVTENDELLILTNKSLVKFNKVPPDKKGDIICNFQSNTKYLSILGVVDNESICLMRPGVVVDWWKNGTLSHSMKYSELFCDDDRTFRMPVFYYCDVVGDSIYVVTRGNENQVCYHLWDIDKGQWVGVSSHSPHYEVPLIYNRDSKKIEFLALPSMNVDINKAYECITVTKPQRKKSKSILHTEISNNTYIVIERNSQNDIEKKKADPFILNIIDISKKTKTFVKSLTIKYSMYYREPYIYLWEDDWRENKSEILTVDCDIHNK